MTLQTALVSIALGSITGLIYGLSFLSSRRRVFSYREPVAKRKVLIAMATSVATRILLLAALFSYLLRSPSINFILLMMAFFPTFWGVVLTKRTYADDGD